MQTFAQLQRGCRSGWKESLARILAQTEKKRAASKEVEWYFDLMQGGF
jgi:hypothetical protein